MFCHPEVDDVGPNASWRTRPKTHIQLIADIISRGLSVSPLFAVPWVTSSIFRVDWLHCADLGVAADYLGNLFWSVLPKLPGRSRTERVSVLWGEVQHFYKTYKVCDKLGNLVETMIRKNQSSPPKLRGKAAEIRALVPFGVQLAETYLSDANEVEAAAKAGIRHLHQCYQSLSLDSAFGPDVLQSEAIAFAWQYTALSKFHDGVLWRLKPKLHLFLELAAEHGRPALCWTYRDEDYGGTIAKLSRRRGGKKTGCAWSAQTLQLFCIYNPVPRLV